MVDVIVFRQLAMPREARCLANENWKPNDALFNLMFLNRNRYATFSTRLINWLITVARAAPEIPTAVCQSYLFPADWQSFVLHSFFYSFFLIWCPPLSAAFFASTHTVCIHTIRIQKAGNQSYPAHLLNVVPQFMEGILELLQFTLAYITMQLVHKIT